MSENEQLNEISTLVKPLPRLSKSRDGITRSQVVEAFQRAFEMVGGVPRLAVWANDNPTEFFRLYAKLLPSTAINIGDNARIVLVHALPPTALDNHPGETLEVVPLREEVVDSREASRDG